ncbi:MAG: stalk domain-containing protein [Candidatus Cryosericum sp.]
MLMKRRWVTVALLVLFVITSCAAGPAHVARGVSVPTVTVSPNTAGVRAKYVIEFDLTTALDKYQAITIQFVGPSLTVLPCTPCNQKIDQFHVFVNGINPLQEVIGNSAIGSIQVRTPVALAAGAHVEIVFDEQARIGNPTVVGTYAADVWTETELVRVTSASYLIGESQLESLTVHPDNDIAGASTGYLVTMATGGRGELVQGKDTVTLTFPASMSLPSTPVPAQVTVNGIQASAVSRVAGINALAIQIPVGVASRSALTVAFLPGFGLENPAARGEYLLLARTSAEPGDVKSDPFVIVDRPAVSVSATVEPLLPDGLNGWYTHIPVVTLTAESNVPGAVGVVYGIDKDAAEPYVNQITIPDGLHTLRFSARNTTAGISAEVTEREFRVASRGPVVSLSGQPSELVGDPSYIVRGSVAASQAPVTSVDVQGRQTHILPDGSFSESLTLLEGKNDIEVAARDEAGLTTFVQREVVLDTVAPALTIDTPLLWSEIASNSVVVRGHVESGSTLEVAGRLVTDVGSDGSFVVPVSLIPGKNTISITAHDKAGNVRQMAIVVTCTAVMSHVVVLTVGKTVMTVDGSSRPVDAGRTTVPIIVQGRTLVPISSVMSAVDGEAVWNAAARTVTLTLAKNTVVLTIGKATALVNGKAVRVDSQDSRVVPVIDNGRTMLPLRFVGESLGASVSWDEATRRVTLTFPAS